MYSNKKKTSLCKNWFVVAFKTVLVFTLTSTTPLLLGVSCQSIGDDLIQPTFVESVDGVLDTTLTIEYATHGTAIHTMTNTRLLNGTMPGPTLKLKAGDTLRVKFQNNLIQQATRNTVENEFSYPDTSNLHFHGAHVSGELPSDDVTLRVDPGQEYQYVTDFPDVHMPGTHWIHPHVHGSGALQVGGGAAAALIVTDPDGYLPDVVADAEDVLLMVQYMELNTLENVALESGDSMLDIQRNVGGQDGSNFRLVNGQYQPTIHMAQNEWQRWRVVYAGWLREPLQFTIDNNECEMALLAKDGIYIQDFPRTITTAPIPTAGRADIMVRCPNAGSFAASDFSGNTILNIQVASSAVSPVDLPTWQPPEIPEYLLDLTQAAVSNGCSCTTRLGGGCTDGAPNCVNGLGFDPNRFLHTIALGSVIERDIRGINAHPYHQHVYPFQLVDNVDALTGTSGDYFKLGDWHDGTYPCPEETYTLVIWHWKLLRGKDEFT